jgi:hypothetical protein
MGTGPENHSRDAQQAKVTELGRAYAEALLSAPAGEVLATIGALQRRWPAMGFVIGGSGLASRLHSRPGIDVCRRVSDAVEAVDAMVKGGSRN